MKESSATTFCASGSQSFWAHDTHTLVKKCLAPHSRIETDQRDENGNVFYIVDRIF